MRRFLGALALMGAGMCLVAYVQSAVASRNSSGTMSAVNGPYVSGTVINSATVNARLADIETEVTDSLDRSGKGGMLAATRGIDGTVAAPAFSWTSETGSGLYRIGSNNPGFAVNGSKRQEWSTTGTTVTGTTTSTGIFLAPDGSVTSPGIGFTSENDGSGTGLYMGAAQSMRVAANGGEVTRFEPTKVTVNASAGLQIGSAGTAIVAIYSGSAALTPAAVTGQTCDTTTNSITVTGAAAGDACMGVSANGFVPGNLSVTCLVNGANSVRLIFCNPTAGNLTPSATTYKVWVIH